MTASASGRLASAGAEFWATAAWVSERTAKRASGRSLNRKLRDLQWRKDDAAWMTSVKSRNKETARNLTVAKTGRIVVVNHADRLHERITDSRPDKLESAFEQVFAECVGELRAGCNRLSGFALQRLPVYKAPDVFIEAAKLLLHFQKRSGIGHCGIDLESIADDAVVVQ